MYFLKYHFKKMRQIKEGEGMEGPEKSMSCGWRKVQEMRKKVT